jgi:hypothetical protein
MPVKRIGLFRPNIAESVIWSSEIYFLLKRAEEEAIAAIRSDCIEASVVHFQLSLRYGKLARSALTGACDGVLTEATTNNLLEL